MIRRLFKFGVRMFKRHLGLPFYRRFHPEVELRLPTGRIRVNLRDRVLAQLLFLDGEYEAEPARFMAEMGLEGKVLIDIGANIGLHTLQMSRLAGASGRVIAFEPQSGNFELLQRNVVINQLTNVDAIRSAVGERVGTCSLAVHPWNHGDHRIAGYSGTHEEVAITTLDEELRSVASGAVSLIKIDVQGYEPYVLAGMHETLRRNPDLVIFIEVFPEGLKQAGSSASQLVESLRNLGFDGWEIHGSRLIPCQDPAVYDLILGGKHQDLILSRNHARVAQILERTFHCRLPAVRQMQPYETALHCSGAL